MHLLCVVVLSSFGFSVGRENGEEDVTIKILFCGVCHSDLHSAKNEWGYTFYPVVPGYDLIFPSQFDYLLSLLSQLLEIVSEKYVTVAKI